MVNRNKLQGVVGLCLVNLLVACGPAKDQSTKTFLEESKDGYMWHSSSSGIVNGEPVLAEDPVGKSTVALYLADEKDDTSVKGICTATLIAKDIVLTAGHCIKDVAEVFLKISVESLTARLRVGFGLPRVTKMPDNQVSFIKVKKLMVHPNYAANMVRKAKSIPMPDLTVIQLETEAPANFEPRAIVTDPSLVKTGATITLSGYGYTSGSNFTLPTQLMKVDVNISNPKLTTAQFSYDAVDGKSACMGDSGGPAYIRGEKGELLLIGVTSWGDNSCSRYGVYTSVPVFADFIQSSIATLHQANSFY